MLVPVAFVDTKRPVRTLALSIGERMVDEACLEDRLHHGTERMMHDAVAEWGGGHQPPLRVVDLDHDIAAGPVAAIAKLPLETQQLPLEIGVESTGAGLAALAEDGAFGGSVQRAEIGDRSEQMIVTLGQYSSTDFVTAAACALDQPPIRRPISSSVRAAWA